MNAADRSDARADSTDSATTALVLAGGAGLRMGGRDKGWQLWRGQPLVVHCLQRLQQQSWPLAHTLISANRHLGDYALLGHPVCPDAPAQAPANTPGLHFAGPMAGVRAGLALCRTPWLLCVPCDAPHLPLDLVQRLHSARLARNSLAAVVTRSAANGRVQSEPMFCLLHTSLAAALQAHWAQGGRSMHHWLQAQDCAHALFEPLAQGPDPFANFNSTAQLCS